MNFLMFGTLLKFAVDILPQTYRYGEKLSLSARLDYGHLLATIKK